MNNNNRKNIYIFGGGTSAHIANHLSVSAPAYGKTAKKLVELCTARFPTMNVNLELTRMAGGLLDTNDDISDRIETIKKDNRTKVIFFSSAIVDYVPTAAFVENDSGISILDTGFGKTVGRIETRKYKNLVVNLQPSKKIISSIRTGRKDIFLVGFKTTCNASKQEMYEKGLLLCKEGSANLVLVNDVVTKWNIIVTPEEAAYHESDNRDEVLTNLVDMAYHRSHLTFTQSTVVEGTPVPWNDPRVPESLRTAVNYCIRGNAYKVFNGSTVGHFAYKLSDTEFLTSIRRSNFNDLHNTGLVYVKTDGPDTVIAYGAKPSVGGQSQRIIFNDHVGMDCVLHFHCPLKPNHRDDIPIKSQREVECGSHACGKNTSDGLKQFGNLKAVMLDKHGPNIVFSKTIDPKEVIDFIDSNFDLESKTGGYLI